MSVALDPWPATWTLQQRSTATIAAASVVLVLFIWGVAMPLSWMPTPIGPVAGEFASGTRVTVWLTIASGLAGIAIGVLTAVAKLAPVAPIRCTYVLDSRAVVGGADNPEFGLPVASSLSRMPPRRGPGSGQRPPRGGP